MAGNQRTRQSNRAYQNHIRQESRNNSSNNRNTRNTKSNSSNDRNTRNTRNTKSNNRNTRNNRNTQNGSSNNRNTRNNRSTPNSGSNNRNSRSARNTRNNSSRSVRNDRSKKTSQLIGQPVRAGQVADEGQQEDLRLRQQPAGQVYFDYTLVFIVFFLVMFGLLMLYTASIYTNSFFLKQCVISLLGIVVMFIFAKIDYHLYAKKPMIILISVCSIVLVLLVLTPLGVELNGARRWIGIESLSSITIQPAEIFKIGVILVNAFLITKLSRQMAKWQVLSIFALLALAQMLFILKVTENLSSGIIVGAITVLMVFVAHPGYKLFIGGGMAGALVVYGYIKLALKYANSSSGGFRSDRIIAWLAPDLLEDQSKVYQTTQALYSIGSGGLWGKGLGAGTQKMILPEAMNDMIFAIICEELGMIGAFLVLVMFAILLYRLMFIAKNSKDLLGGMIATGIFAHFMLQVVLNVGVVTNMLPSTGVTLPFISAGGTASVLLLAEIGIALNVSRQIDFEQPKLVRRRKKQR